LDMSGYSSRMLTAAELEAALQALGELLQERGHAYELAIIGGGALSIGTFIQRSTKDLDIVAMIDGDKLRSAAPLPEPLLEAIADIAGYLSLAIDWLNNGPTSMLRFGLPYGLLSSTTQR